MHINDTKVQPIRALTYFGSRCEMSAVRKGGPISERVIVTRWLDDADERNGGHPAGSVVLRHIKGDGRKPATFQEFGQRVLPASTTHSDAMVTAAAML